TTLFLSQGVPMLLGGDELGRTQQGNNNAWCQDNELSWFDWELDEERERLLEFTRALIAYRARHPVFRRRTFFTGASPRGSGVPDIWWFRPDGRKMTQRDWSRPEARAIGVFLNGDEIPTPGPHGEAVVDDSFLLLFNAHHEPIAFRLPTRRLGARWLVGGRDSLGGGAGGDRRRRPLPARPAPGAVGARPEPKRRNARGASERGK